MTTEQEIRWGIMGAGRIAHSFYRDLQLVDGTHIVGVASRTQTTAEEFAQQYPDISAYPSYADMLADPEIDAIYIASPHTFHFEQCREAMLAGKHVLCEKPVTVSRQECELLIATSYQTQRFFMEAMWTYFLPALQTARRWYQEGRIGELVQLKGDFGYPIEYGADKREYNKALAGGCLLEMGIYPLAFAYFFLQTLPEHMEISASLAPNNVEDDVMIQSDYHDVTAHLATSYKARLPNWGFVVGSKGYIAIPDFFRAHSAELHELDTCVERFDDGRQGGGFEFEIAEACRCIRAGLVESPVMSHATSLDLQEQMESIRQQILPDM